MTPAQASQIAEYHARLAFVSSRAIADKVKEQALASGADAVKWAQSMPNVSNGWAWWDAVSGRFEQALTEAMAGRDPLGERPVHHRWRVPLTAADARVIDEYAALHFSDVSGMLHPTPAFTCEDDLKAALAALTPSKPTTPPTGAPPRQRA